MSSPNLRARLAAAVADRLVVQAVHLATWRKVDQRAAAMAELRHYEALRHRAAQLRRHVLENLPRFLDQFTAQLESRGVHVHRAADAAAARRIIAEIATTRGLKLAVKSKSMTTEEVALNDALEQAGVRVVETDLGEFIVQLDHDRPSHIITPIIHKDRRQVAQTMARELGCEYTEDPTALAKIARRHLRDIFRRCDLGITGVNFGVAETGTLCLVTNEGNGRLTVTRPRVHVALLGIEKLVPRLVDLPVFLKLLARSSTGQPLGAYTTLITGPRRPGDADGPQEVHVVLLDNGRSDILAGPLPEVLRCVRCGACLNACPAYRNLGGHAYNSVYPGPIGSLLSPLLQGHAHDELPRVSSLCGACQIACPVKIDIPALLVRLRRLTRDRQPWTKRLGLAAWAWAMKWPGLYRFGQALLREVLPDDGDGWATRGVGLLRNWTVQRDLPRPAARSFRRLWDEELREEAAEHVPGDCEAALRPATQDREAPLRGEPLPPPPDATLHEVEVGTNLPDRFATAAAAVGARVWRTDACGLFAVIRDILREHAARSVFLEVQPATALTPERATELTGALTAAGVRVCTAPDDETLFSADAAVTGVQAAVAETGTVVCVSGAQSARGASLIPPVHIALLSEAQLVGDLFDLFPRLAAGELPANVNLITGPSKTADIEGVLVTGMHGPGAVEVVLVRESCGQRPASTSRLPENR